jgi:HK97 family phage major capsid protein
VPEHIPTAVELRAAINLDRPTREDLERVHAAIGAHGMARVAIDKKARDAGRDKLASEARAYDQHGEEIGRIGQLALEVEQRLPLDPGARKLRFGSSRYPAAGQADYTKLQRLGRDHSVVDWLAAQGGKADFDADAGWEAFTRGLITDDWRSWRADFGSHMELAMSTAEPGGGYLVPDLMSARIIDRLRAATPIFDAGAQTVPMTASTLDIPRITGDPTATWHAESGTITPSDATIDRVRFTAKTLPFIVKVSRELQEDAPGLGAAVQMAIRGAAMAELTRVALRGDGTANSPTGIRNQSGVTLFAIGANGGPVTLDMLRACASRAKVEQGRHES